MRAGGEPSVTTAELERAYRADSRFVLSLAPWMFIVGMGIEAASHWRTGPAYVFWPHLTMAVASAALLVAVRFKAVGQRYPEVWLLVFWSFMLSSAVTHTIAMYPGELRLPQLVLALSVVATGALILPTVAGGLALAGCSAALFALFAIEYSTEVVQKLAVPVVITFMAMLVFLARRWVIRQGLLLRGLDRELAESRAQAESARRVAELSTRMSAGFAHHFNNQLQSALLGAEGIRRAVKTGQSTDQWLDIVEGAVKRGINLTGRLLRYSQAPRFEPRPLRGAAFLEGVDLSGAVSEGREVIRHADDVAFDADGTQLGIAIVELVRNADAAMKDRPDPVRLALATAGDWIEITVTDTGSGIPETLEGRPTEPFVTGDPVRRFGLGLALAAQIAQHHQGELGHRPGPSGGTVASLRFPRSTGGRWEVALPARAEGERAPGPTRDQGR